MRRTCGLTPREIRVLEMLASGDPNKQIAYKLEVCDGTVKNHLNSLYAKTGCATRVQLVLWFMDQRGKAQNANIPLDHWLNYHPDYTTLK